MHVWLYLRVVRNVRVILLFFFKALVCAVIYTLSLHDALPILSAADLPPSPTKSSNLSETAEVPACNVPSRSPLPALAIAPNKTRDGLIRVRNIRALNGRFNTSITHAYSIVIGSKHITLNATGGGFLTASKQFRHGATSKSRSNTASNSTKHKSPHLSGWRQIISLIT